MDEATLFLSVQPPREGVRQEQLPLLLPKPLRKVWQSRWRVISGHWVCMRHLWPLGVHVALVLIDAVVDTPATRRMMPDKPNSFFTQPDDIAETIFGIRQQNPLAWTFEIEVRPFGETW